MPPTTTHGAPTLPGNIDALIDDILPAAVATRRDIHANPELAYTEKRTHDLVAKHLTDLGIEHVTGLAGGTGLLAHIPATTDNGAHTKSIAFRADMDALPILEATGAPYASTTPGVMHACGHDGHTANLLAFARLLTKLEHRPHPITLVFQPAEEGGAGGKRMCEDGALDGSRVGPPVARIFGLHGWPDLTLGHVATRHGPLLAATDTFEITVTGKQAHGAFPHFGRDPILALSHVVTALQSVASRTVSPLDSVVVTVGQFNAGSAVNVIPTDAKARGTLRTLKAETRATAKQRINEIAAGVAQGLGCTADVHWRDGYPVTANEQHATDTFFDTARDTFGDGNVLTIPEPFMGGEDFAFYSLHVPACFFVVGLNPPGQPEDAYPKLHTPKFDFNDDALPIALRAFTALALADHAEN